MKNKPVTDKLVTIVGEVESPDHPVPLLGTRCKPVWNLRAVRDDSGSGLSGGVLMEHQRGGFSGDQNDQRGAGASGKNTPDPEEKPESGDRL